MKIAATMAAMAMLVGMSNIAKAQAPTSGNPFLYSITGDFIDGEPNATYTTSGGKASVQVGGAALYYVTNTDTRIRTSAPTYTLQPIFGLKTGGPILIPPAAPLLASGSANVPMNPNQMLQYSLHFDSSSDQIPAGSYQAWVNFNIADGKTQDWLQVSKVKFVTVN